MNVAFAVSVAILELAAMVQQFFPMRVASEDVWRLIPRMNVRHETIIDEVGSLAEGALNCGARNVLFGKSTTGAQGYMGPRPVPGHGPHHYCFYVLALNRPVGVPRAPKLNTFLKNISGRTIGYGCLVGIYERD